jgi:ABC-2 type transport system permease protein
MGDVLRSEWTRLRTVRSTYWTLLGAAVFIVGLAAIVCSVEVAQFDKLTARDKAAFNPVTFSLVGAGLGQLAVGVLGVLIITNEYASGMIRTTFASTPQRSTVLVAKSAVFGAVTFVVTTLASFGAFFVGQAILSRKNLGVTIGEPGALRSVVGSGLFLAVLGLFALGLGTILRKTAGAIAALFGVLFILPVIVSLLPSSMDGIQKYLPSNAGQEIIFGSGQSSSDVLSPWVGFAVFCLYAIVTLTIAATLLVRRDA